MLAWVARGVGRSWLSRTGGACLRRHGRDSRQYQRHFVPRPTRLSFADIAIQLNEQGHRNRAGRPWTGQMVYHVLR